MELTGISGGIIVAIVDFLMVFLILGGLMLAIQGLKKLVTYFGKPKIIPEAQPQTAVSEPVPVSPPSAGIPQTNAHIAAIAAAIYEFTSMPEGSLRIVSVQENGASSAWKLSGRLDF
jgi:hypothetical protein